MSIDNPYDFQDSYTGAPGAAEHQLRGVVEELRMTRPWVRLIGILGMIGVVLMSLFGIVGLALSLVAAGSGGFALLGFNAFYLLIAFLCGYPCWKLVKYGSAIRAVEESGTMLDLERALAEQRVYWRFVGIMTALVIGFYLLAAIGVALFGFIART